MPTWRKTSVSTITGYISSLLSTFIARNYTLYSADAVSTLAKVSQWILFRLERVTTTIPQSNVKFHWIVYNAAHCLLERWRFVIRHVIRYDGSPFSKEQLCTMFFVWEKFFYLKNVNKSINRINETGRIWISAS